MSNIDCKLFGCPEITEDGKEVYIPTGKLSAFLYYILLKKVVSRDEIAGLFWSASNEENAKISLRNALHKIRKMFKENIILSPNKSILMLNETVDFYIDVKEFEENPMENLSLYTGDFLKGFYVKDAVEFECWTSELSSFYKEIFIRSSEKKIKEIFSGDDTKEVEILINKLLSIDNFNDVAYIHLMKLYKIKNRYDKIINEYYNLYRLMNEELGIDPPREIELLYNEAVSYVGNSKNKKNKEKNFDLYSREYEYELIQKNIDDFYSGKSTRSILIKGESGIGKSILKNKIIEKNRDRFKFYEVFCYSIEKNFSFSPWMKIVKSLEKDLLKNNLKRPYLWENVLKNLFFDSVTNIQPSVEILETRENFNFDLMYNTIYSAFEILGKDIKVIITFEDIQWADQLTIKLLIHLILHINNNVLFILTKSNENEERIDKLFSTLNDLEKLTTIELKPFDKREVDIIVKKILGSEVSNKDIEDMYTKSKGNSFFLKEYIELFKNGEKDRIVSSKMYNILENKFSNLSEKELDLLKVISTFYGNVTLDILLKILDIKAFEVLKSLNSLVRLHILEEKKEDRGVIIRFSYSAYKDYMYNELSNSSKQIINQEIARVLEAELLNNTKDITIYNRLRFHYQEANQEIESLKYEVYILNYYLNFNHEIYPNLDDYDLTKQVKLSITNEKVLKWIDEIEKKLLFIKNSKKNKSNTEKIMKIELLFLYCKGRYLVRAGSYSEGVSVINRVISFSRELQDITTELCGYKQMIIYGIQINNPNIMLKNVVKGIKVAKTLKNSADIGVFYRLYGVYYLMVGDFKTAESLFGKSINFFLNFEKIENRSSISVAANYNYIGEIRRTELKYEEALEYFQRAIDLCKKSEAACLSIFYINAGKTSYLMGNFEDMKKYFLLSKEIVMKFDSYWRVSVLDSFLALISFIEKKYLKSIQYLKNAISEKAIINNPRDIGTVYFVEAIITSKIEKTTLDKVKELKEFLPETSQSYCYNAIKYLDSARDAAEIKYLKDNIIY